MQHNEAPNSPVFFNGSPRPVWSGYLLLIKSCRNFKISNGFVLFSLGHALTLPPFTYTIFRGSNCNRSPKKSLQKTKKEPDKTPTDSRSLAHEAKGFCAVRSVDTFCRTLDDTCQIQSRWQTLAFRSRPSADYSPAWPAKHSLMNLLEHISNAGLFAADSCFFWNKPVKS